MIEWKPPDVKWVCPCRPVYPSRLTVRHCFAFMSSPSQPNSQLLARALRGCWRETPPPNEIDADLWPQIVPLLVGSGAGALAWRRLRHGALHDCPAVAALREAHRAQALHMLLQERRIVATFARLHQHDIAAILLKGWSCARQYPEAGLRPLGDIDVLVRPAQKALVEQVLGVSVDDETNLEADFVDTKSYLRPIYGFDADEVWQARQKVMLRETPLSVLGEEDQLRMLCLHFLRHGAWRPLWLCDIAVALEARSDAFDWARCLSSDRRRADAVACALGLAHQLLDARTADTPIGKRARSLPRWLVPAVLREWERPLLSQHQSPETIADLLHRGQWRQAIFGRWPNPIEAALLSRTSLNWSPFLAQLLFFTDLNWRSFRRAPKLLRPVERSADTLPS